MARPLRQQMARTAGLFQGLTALPTMLDMGFWTLSELWSPYYRLYRFITAACIGLMAAGIVFSILVQRHPNNTKASIFYFEVAKSGLATAMWLWLILDASFASHESDKWSSLPPEQLRMKRIAQAAMCFVALPILYYPTLVFAFLDMRSSKHEVVCDEEESAAEGSEREPLLREPSA